LRSVFKREAGEEDDTLCENERSTLRRDEKDDEKMTLCVKTRGR